MRVFMRVLLIGPVHREKEFLEQKGVYPFLKGQGQQSWVEALEELRHKVFVFRYTDSILTPNLVRVYMRDFLEKLSPVWYGRFRRFGEKYYFLSLENYLKNQKLKEEAKNAKPNLIIISGGITSIFPTAIEKIKSDYQCKVLLFSGVNPFTSSTKVEKILIKKGIIDIVVENDRGYGELWKKMGATKVIVLPISSVDPKLHRKVQITPQKKREYECDVCFVGSLTKERQEILTELVRLCRSRHSGERTERSEGADEGARLRAKQDRGDARLLDRRGSSNSRIPSDLRDSGLARMTIKIWGDILPTIGLHSELKPYYQRAAYGEKMVKIFNAAKIVLNFQPADMTHGGNMRTFEIPGCGAFQLADRIDEQWFKEGKEYIGFHDIEDLLIKIKYFLEHHDKRKKVAMSGHKKVYKEHTYKKHLIKLLNSL